MDPTSTASQNCSRIELTIWCRSLKNKDVTSKSDPMCILMLKNEENDKYEEIGRTERVENSLNPDFTTKMLLTYHFEIKQALQFCVYDCDEGLSNPKKADELGSLRVTLAEVVQGHLRNGRLLEESGNKQATLFVTARETVDCRQSYVFNFVGRKLDDKDFITKSDPFLVFHKRNSHDGFTPVGQTTVIRDDLNPNWPAFRINCATFCDNNPQLELKIDCYDHERDGKHDLIGTFYTTAAELTSQSSGKEFQLIHPKKKEKKSSYKNSGLIFLERHKLEEDWEFSHFVQAGLQLNFTVAIDYSASNAWEPKANGSTNNDSPIRTLNG
ncbi:copine-8-like [Convolutriloba macropyga]|uniref:copine-8-like n=1 Tax=Convolutriloba macropyga TaxID=536237 RepID=UPI003F525F2D